MFERQNKSIVPPPSSKPNEHKETATMRFMYSIASLVLLVVSALATSSTQKPVVVSYPKGTPDHIVEEAMEAVRKAVRLYGNASNMLDLLI